MGKGSMKANQIIFWKIKKNSKKLKIPLIIQYPMIVSRDFEVTSEQKLWARLLAKQRWKIKYQTCSLRSSCNTYLEWDGK
jgi:hypothetical protein